MGELFQLAQTRSRKLGLQNRLGPRQPVPGEFGTTTPMVFRAIYRHQRSPKGLPQLPGHLALSPICDGRVPVQPRYLFWRPMLPIATSNVMVRQLLLVRLKHLLCQSFRQAVRDP